MIWRARTDGLMSTEAGSELIVYEAESTTIHHLDPLATLVWRQVDAHQSVPSLTTVAQAALGERVTPESVDLALRQLHDIGLLEGYTPSSETQSRRTLVRRAAIGGAVIPAIASITVPMAAAASSTACTTPPDPSLRLYTENCTLTLEVAGFCPNTDVTVSIVRQQPSSGEEIPYGDLPMRTNSAGYASTGISAGVSDFFRARASGLDTGWYQKSC